jgi:type II secretory pathway pseudopilin PulG
MLFPEHRRPGTTMIEVLVAIFVMGIGLLALLTLFPLGALNMQKAIQDSRVAQVAAGAQSLAEALDLRNDPNIYSPSANVDLYSNPDPNALLAPNSPPNLATLAGYDGPSYPVYLDPFGYFSSLGLAQTWVSGNATYGPTTTSYGLPRNTASFLNNNAVGSIRWFTLMDDIRFNNDASADLTTGEIEREGGISFAYLFRRPRLSVISDVDMSVVVYAQRPLRLTGQLDLREYAFSASYDTTQNIVTLTWNPAIGQAPPDIGPGDWILDPTIETVNGMPVPHGFFYRVSDVNMTSTTTMNVQVQTPFKQFPKNAQTPGVVIVLQGVVEVLEKGSGWQP